MDEEEKDLCDRCKYFYDLDTSIIEYHTLCSKGNCYLCACVRDKCDDFEEGKVPEGRARGEWKI